MLTLRARRACVARRCPASLGDPLAVEHRHRSRWRAVTGTVLSAAALVVPAQASAETTRTEIHIPLTVLTNLCAENEPVALSGDEYITTTTTPRPDGSFTVTASIVAPNLTGTGMVSNIPYSGVDGQQTYSYIATPPFPSTYDVTLFTILRPAYKLASMYLVTVIRQTIAFDGTPVTTFRSVSLTCKQPTCGHRRWS